MGAHWSHLRDACRHGHPYPQNLARLPNGQAYCRGCQRRKQRAIRAAYAKPDDLAIQRAVEGDPPEHLTRSEREAVVVALTAQGVPAWRIAEQARCTPRTVHRIRTRTAA